MPVETFIQTTPRTVVTYLVKPLHDQITRASTESPVGLIELGHPQVRRSRLLDLTYLGGLKRN
jgi:hypothetical protein